MSLSLFPNFHFGTGKLYESLKLDVETDMDVELCK